MVRFNPFTASAILAYCAVVSGLPTEATLEYREQLGHLPVDQIPASVAHVAAVKPFQHIHLSPENIGNLTEVAPSQSVIDAVSKRAIGNDDRVLWDNTNYPYAAMGRLIWSNGVYCSATLVGRRHVAAARHCAPLDGQQVTLTFQPDFYNTDRFPSSTVTTGVYIPKGQTGDCDVKEDWAIFILADPLGDQHGYLGARVINQSSELNTALFTTFGYPGDLAGGARPYRMTGVTVRRANSCESGGPLDTDADSAGGQSGSALFRDDSGVYTYGALSVGVFSNNVQVATYYSSGANFVNAVGQTRVNYP